MKILAQKLDRAEIKLGQLGSQSNLSENDLNSLKEMEGYLGFYRSFLSDIKEERFEVDDMTALKQKIHEFCNTVELISQQEIRE